MSDYEQIRRIRKEMLQEHIDYQNSIIKWDYWKNLPNVKLWEAILLANAYNPHDKLSQDFLEDGEAEKLIRLLDGNLANRKFFSAKEQSHVEINYREVSLKEFAVWAKSINWKLPEELSKFADIPLNSQRPNNVTKTIQEQRFEEIIRITKEFGYQLMSIPLGGKDIIKKKCLESPQLFTDSTFAKAWKEASKANLISHQDKNKYNRRF
jgi:hypothetical protein